MVMEDVSLTLPVAGLTLPAVLLVSSVPVLIVLDPPSPRVSASAWDLLDGEDGEEEAPVCEALEFMEPHKLTFCRLEVAREGTNRSDIPKSIDAERFEFLRRLDEEREVLLLLLWLVPVLLVVLYWETLALLLLLLKKVVLL